MDGAAKFHEFYVWARDVTPRQVLSAHKAISNSSLRKESQYRFSFDGCTVVFTTVRTNKTMNKLVITAPNTDDFVITSEQKEYAKRLSSLNFNLFTKLRENYDNTNRWH